MSKKFTKEEINEIFEQIKEDKVSTSKALQNRPLKENTSNEIYIGDLSDKTEINNIDIHE